ncbi:cell death-inducing p53-target protein 1-like [Galleria mellonella]|nr:cell death-inducing p53-target protein 1-like [Galleria mellonella]
MKAADNKEVRVDDNQSVYPPLNEAEQSLPYINPPPYPGLPQAPSAPGISQVTPERAATPMPATISAVNLEQSVGPNPTRVTCKSCYQNVTTRISRNPTIRTHLIALLFCVFGLWFCACLP